MNVQFDKSQYSTVGRSSCLVHAQWMKDQSRTVNPCMFKCMYSSWMKDQSRTVNSCIFKCMYIAMCVCGGGQWGGGGGWVGVTLGHLAL